jgi:hypothetical protein
MVRRLHCIDAVETTCRRLVTEVRNPAIADESGHLKRWARLRSASVTWLALAIAAPRIGCRSSAAPGLNAKDSRHPRARTWAALISLLRDDRHRGLLSGRYAGITLSLEG